MADRLVVMSNGQVQQVGSQRELYEQPGQHLCRGLRRPHQFPARPRRGARPLPHAKAALPSAAATTLPPTAACWRCGPSACRLPPRPSPTRQLLSRDRRVRLVSRRHPGILCALDAAGPADGAGAEQACRCRACGRRSDPFALAGRGQPRACRRWRRHGLIDERHREIGRYRYGQARLGHHAAPVAQGHRRARRRFGDRWLLARVGAVRRPHRPRHVGRRLFEAPREEHRHAAAGAEEIRGRARHRRRFGAAREDARRSAAAARHERPAGPFARRRCSR